MLSNGLRPCCTGALPGGSLCTIRGTSCKFFLAYRIHDGVSEVKTMAVAPFDRETSPWTHGVGGFWSRQSEKNNTIFLEQAKLGSSVNFSLSADLPAAVSRGPLDHARWGMAVVTHPAGIVSAACESRASQGAVAPGRERFLVRLIPQRRLCCACLIRDCCFLYWYTKYKWRNWSNILEVANVRSQ